MFVLSSLPAAGRAAGQPAGTDVGPAVSQGILQQVIVTAERRAQPLQTTAIALTALSSKELADRGVRDMPALQFVTPALSMTKMGFTENINIRGIGLNVQSPTIVSGVAVYHDGVIFPGSAFADIPFFDISDVEVLRGPQGTFVGQNSTGGAILITSRNPRLNDRHGYIEGQVGNYSDESFQGAVDLPISDTMAARFAFFHESRNSFFTNVNSNSNQPGNLNETGARVTVLYKPNDKTTVNWKTEYDTNNTDGIAQRPIPGTPYASLAPANLWSLNYDRTDSRYDSVYIRSSLNIKHTFSNGLRIRSVSGAQYSSLNMLWDEDATLAPTLASALPGSYEPQFAHERDLTQEVDLLSPDLGFFRWVVGATYLHRDIPVHFKVYSQDPAGAITQTVTVVINNPNTSYGIFGQGAFELTNKLEVKAGLRFSHDRTGERGFVNINPGPTLPNNVPSFSDSKVTGKVSFNYKLDRNNFLYAFVAKGYKQGGPNIVSTATFSPESVWDYEMGWKSTFAHRHIRTQLDGFYMNYKDFQLSVFNPVDLTNSETNLGGTSKIYGAELQLQGRFASWTVSLNGSYVNSTLGGGRLIDTRTLPNGGNGLGPQCPTGVTTSPSCFNYSPYFENVNGSRNPYSPKFSGNLAVQYEWRTPIGRLTPRLSYSYIGSQFTTVFNNPQHDLLSPRRLLAAQLALARGEWIFTVYGTNLTNQTYVAGQQGNNEFLGAPRQYGVRAGIYF